jgi:hypothetical protein
MPVMSLLWTYAPMYKHGSLASAVSNCVKESVHENVHLRSSLELSDAAGPSALVYEG